MSSNTIGSSTAGEIADYELSLRYFVLRILLEGVEGVDHSQLQPCELVKQYLPYALNEYGSNIMPHVLRLGNLEDLHGYFCDLLAIMYSPEQLELSHLHALGQVIGECEKGICAKLSEEALRGNKFFNDLMELKTLKLSAEQRDCLFRGRGAGWNTDLDSETQLRRAMARLSVAASMADSDETALAREDNLSGTSTADSVLEILETAVNRSNEWNYVMSNREGRPRSQSNATTITFS